MQGQEILSPQFSPDGQFIVLVTRGYWPDGADAEGLPDSNFDKLQARAKADPRFADPVVQLIALNGKVVCEVKYGWNPSVSPDDRHIVFSEQVKPITGFRELASPLAGNGIRMFDCRTKEVTWIADPGEGYLDKPFFSADGSTVFYTLNEAVNGANGGSVGITGFNLQQKRTAAFVEKQTVPAVPCPPALKCDANLTRSFQRIVFQIATAGTDVFALLGTPVPSPGDMYTARKYNMELVSVLPQRKAALRLGTRDAQSDDDVVFQPASGERALIYSKYWQLYSLTGGERLPDPGPENTNPKSVYSPDLR